jgi:hypothetical protein
MTRPRLFLDTNVCGKLIVPPHSRYALRFMAAVRRRYRIAVAATTVLELLRCPKPGPEEFFRNDQAKFRACICGDEFPRYLGFPVDFAMAQILGVTVADRVEPSYFKRSVKAILRAGTQQEFFNSFDHQKHERRMKMCTPIYRAWLTEAKSKQYVFPMPERWAIQFAASHGIQIGEEQSALLAKGLSALYVYERTIFEIADANQSLDTAKRDSDWIDAQQLVYLSEPDMHLLTDDRGLKERASASNQSDRILFLPDFVREMDL